MVPILGPYMLLSVDYLFSVHTKHLDKRELSIKKTYQINFRALLKSQVLCSSGFKKQPFMVNRTELHCTSVDILV